MTKYFNNPNKTNNKKYKFQKKEMLIQLTIVNDTLKIKYVIKPSFRVTTMTTSNIMGKFNVL